MGVTTFRDLPEADRDLECDGAAADRRVRTWAGAEDEPDAEYRDAHLTAVADFEDVDIAKPAPDTVGVAFDRAGVAAERALFVRDATGDVEPVGCSWRSVRRGADAWRRRRAGARRCRWAFTAMPRTCFQGWATSLSPGDVWS